MIETLIPDTVKESENRALPFGRYLDEFKVGD